eukprot:TRINITY_DN19197_c0_g1_i2.p1 TRINITY_DN19197_c0_g1~~TRINITY_DN19197_c0_g1_i2.p1  ORF type:complete len:182 (-),score=26.87 TRINITY_DN19197_c0_g1_i2:917-1462(-)
MDFVWKLWCMEFIFLVGAMGGLPLAVCQEQQADFLWPVPRVLRTLPADIINDATSFVPSDSLRERDEAVASDLPAGAAFLAAVLRVASLQLNPLDAVQFFAYRYQFDLVIREQLASFVCERLACPTTFCSGVQPFESLATAPSNDSLPTINLGGRWEALPVVAIALQLHVVRNQQMYSIIP